MEETVEVNEAFQRLTRYVYRKPNPYPKATKRLGAILLVVNIAIPIVKLTIGFTHIGDCPTNPYVPLFLCITGILQLSFVVTFVIKILSKMAFQLVLGVACLSMFLIGSVTTFAEYQPDFYLDSWRYCDYSLFIFAYYCYIVEYLLLSVITLYVCIVFAFYSVKE
ncbi:unnamed protein product [Acanthoscelides obtectus]|uniref:Uncharacterized protein n=1 Tax=Acanthoscelides obtectus TaxID=200917 RepID=A0A9P0P2C5_ACAOB|nr:unnamed protein product [Acanthoscelides obtectus]CAK1676684.1 hypothetical protein AOBTE_LOCUS30903 [Acanthoscelides obtectus]